MMGKPGGVLSAVLFTLKGLCVASAFSLRRQSTPLRSLYVPSRTSVLGAHGDYQADVDRTDQRRAGGEKLTRRNVILQTAATALTVSAGNMGYTPLPAQANDATAVPTVRLGNGKLEVSRTIQGYWQLAGGHGRYREEDAIENMKQHFDAGITTLDTADIYGPSELIVGKFVASQPKAIPCTKFCCFRFLDEIDRNEVRTRINRARERLQVDKLPLVQFFWSDYSVRRYLDVGLMLTELKEEGLIGEIGATNFDLKRLEEMKKADIPIVSHQVQLSALDRRPVQSGMAQWCAENGVGLIAFGTVGSGILSNLYLGKEAPSQQDKSTASMRMYSNTASRFGSWNLVQDLLKTMDAVAAEVRKTGRCDDANISNVAQRYLLDGTPAVASLLVGVRNTNHIAENVRTHCFRLEQGEIDAIDAIVKKRSGPRGDVWDIERGNI